MRTNGANNNREETVNNNTLDTINAAASAIASSHNRVSQPNLQKKKWGNWLNISGCFGYQKNRKRISHAVVGPETTPPGADPSAAVGSTQAPSITLPFVAPPSSPASFFQSEPPSTVQSPVGIVSFTSVSASMYSPGGPASIFAIGPYAHETQLVSPPVFSASSTAPFTPPPESVHLTTPSSPEVPFAQLLDPNYRNGETYQRFQISHYDFHSYHFQPGSPVGQLISPRSAFTPSGTSSPLPDSELTDPSKSLNLDKLSTYENQKSNQGSGTQTPDALRSATHAGFLQNQWLSEIKMSPHRGNNCLNEISISHRVSFELSSQNRLGCVEKKPTALASASAWTKVMAKLKTEAAATAEHNEEDSGETRHDDKQAAAETRNNASLTLSLGKEFDFNNADGGDSHEPHVVAEWWANEKVAGKEEGGTSENWSFFPVIQPGLS